MASPSVTGLAAPIPSRYTEGTWHSPGYRNGSTRARWAQGLFIELRLPRARGLCVAVGRECHGHATNGSLTSTEAASFVNAANGIDGLYVWWPLGLRSRFLPG